MSALSNYTELRINQWLAGTNFPAIGQRYLALNNGSPTDTGTGGTDVTLLINSGGRQAIDFNAPVGRSMDQNGAVNWGNSENATQFTHWKVYDAASGGNLIAWGSFNQTYVVALNGSVVIPDQSVTITAQAGSHTDYLVGVVLNWAGNLSATAAPAGVYVALYLGDPQGAGTEVTTVVTASRPQLTWQGTDPITNLGNVSYGLSAGATDADNQALFDAAAVGNMLLSDTLIGGTVNIVATDLVQFQDGQYTNTQD